MTFPPVVEPTTVEWRDGSIVVRVDAEKERVAAGYLMGQMVNISAMDAVHLRDMLGNAVAWLDRYISQVAER